MALVGIDLGTTFSLIARLTDDGDPQIIPNSEGVLTTPSAVYFDSAEDVVVGKHAVSALRDTPEFVIQHPKRHIGDDGHHYEMHGQKISPLAASSLILRKLKQDAEQQIGPIQGAVITVPAYFDETRRQATVAAGQLAGLMVTDIINEPTAAALANAYISYRRASANSEEALKKLAADTSVRHTIVYDLGGGTFDVTVLKQQGPALSVLATAGDVQLGGIDWTERIVDQIAEFFVATHEVDPRQDKLGKARLYDTAEQIKLELSSRRGVSWEFSFRGKFIDGQMTREAFDADTSDLLYRTENRMSRVLRDAGLTWDEIDSTVAVGGSSRLPQVLEMLEEVSGKKPDTSLSPDQIVAQGAAIHAAMLGARAIQPSGMPDEQDTEYQYSAPKDAMAAGTALQTETETEEAEVPLLKWGKSVLKMLHLLKTENVNSHTLGVIARDRNGTKLVSAMIPRNTPLPASVTKTFGTIVENQKRVTAEVVEGEADDPAHCISVCTCSVTGLPNPLPKNSPVDIRFHYDSSGRLHVEVVHVTSGAWGEVTIKRTGGIDPERIHINRELLSRMTVG